MSGLSFVLWGNADSLKTFVINLLRKYQRVNDLVWLWTQWQHVLCLLAPPQVLQHVGVYVTPIGCLSLCGLAMNWQLVQDVTLPSPSDHWERLQLTPVTLRSGRCWYWNWMDCCRHMGLLIFIFLLQCFAAAVQRHISMPWDTNKCVVGKQKHNFTQLVQLWLIQCTQCIFVCLFVWDALAEHLITAQLNGNR